MAQANYTPISLYYSTTASAVPTAANLVQGELAINTNDGKLYYEDSSGVVQVLATKSTGSIGGSNTQVQFNNSGSLGGSSGLTWDGSFLTTSSIKNSALTSGRVTYAGASGLLSDNANFVFNGTSLGVGTASPDALLDVTRSGNGQIAVLQTTATRGFSFESSSDTAIQIASIQASTNLDLFANTLSFSTGGSERMQISSDGNLFVGRTSDSDDGGLTLAGDGFIRTNRNGGVCILANRYTSDGQCVVFRRSGTTVGSIDVTTILTTYNTTSDYRLKTVTGAVTGQGERLDALKPVDYLWTKGGQKARGFLAHEFQAVYSSSVSGTKDAVDADGNPEYQSMQAATSEVIADLVAEIQSLRQRIATLENK